MSPSIHAPVFLRARLRFWAFLASFALLACRSAPVLPFRAEGEREHATQGLPAEERAELWVSYQIVIDAVDGQPTDYRAEGPCVYFKLVLPAGGHRLSLRLDYRSPTHRVSTKVPTDLQVDLVPGGIYRLLDLSSQELSQRSFAPFLLEGAPSAETLHLATDSP